MYLHAPLEVTEGAVHRSIEVMDFSVRSIYIYIYIYEYTRETAVSPHSQSVTDVLIYSCLSASLCSD